MAVVHLDHQRLFLLLQYHITIHHQIHRPTKEQTHHMVIHRGSRRGSEEICFCIPEEQMAYQDEQKRVHKRELLSLGHHRALLLRRKHQPL